MNTLKIDSSAKSGRRIINYTLELCEADIFSCLKYENPRVFGVLCQQGCKNFNRKWSCPPNSPTFSAVSQRWEKLFIFFLHVEMTHFADVKNPYLRVKAANSMLKSRADKFVRKLSETEGRAISTGSCRLCRPCHYQKNEKCAHPDIMAYSYEAMGVNVDALVQEYFGKPLLWYRDKVVPEYTSVVCGYLTNDSISLEKLQGIYLGVINDGM